MRWPWRRRPRVSVDESLNAQREAEQKLAETYRKGSEVREVSENLRRLRHHNRFAEMIAESMRMRHQ